MAQPVPRIYPSTVELDDAAGVPLARRLARVNLARTERGLPPMSAGQLARLILAQAAQQGDSFHGE
jgi:hypothetical protein